MDPGVVVFMIPIVGIAGFFSWMIAISPLGKAVADRIRHGPTPRGGAQGGQEEVLSALEDLRREVAELAERVDFTERLLAKHREAERLARPQ
jgi:hypothetical protein